jgi:amidase
MLSLPVLSQPCGMTSDHLPVGMQIVGKPRGEAELLSIARAIEQAIGEWTTSEPQLTTLLRELDQQCAVPA